MGEGCKKMNDFIRMLLSHRSIRTFRDEPLTNEQIEYMVKSAQAAASSSFMQPYTIIGVKNKELKDQLAEFSGNKYVAKNGHFFVFCMDLNRHRLAAEMEGYDIQQFNTTIDSIEWFMFGLIDTAIAAQNLVTAAESMGLGICYIGGIRNNLEKVCEVLNTPDRVIPLFGMCVGYPEQDPDVKPRLPMENIYHEDGYNLDEAQYKEQLEEYNKILSNYYLERTNGKRNDRWTEQVVEKLRKENRAYIKEFLEGKKIPLK